MSRAAPFPSRSINRYHGSGQCEGDELENTRNHFAAPVVELRARHRKPERHPPGESDGALVLVSPPPIAKKSPVELLEHGHVRVDPYYWLRERDDPEVTAYLEQENAYTEEAMAHTQELQTKLFEEITGRLVPDDRSVPYRRDGYFYYHRFEEGREYAVHCRATEPDGKEQVLVDGNPLAKGQPYFALGLSGVSFDQRILAYSTDTVGRRIYAIHFKDLETGALLEDTIPEVTGDLAWAADHRTFFYTKQHPETLRAFRVYRHRLGTDPGDDDLVYEETDETFHLTVFTSKSKSFVLIASEASESAEYRYLRTDDPEGSFSVVQTREPGHEYSVSHYGDHFFILTNAEAKNFRLMKTAVATPGRAHWEEVIAHRDDVLLEDFALFDNYLVLVERHQGLRRIFVKAWQGEQKYYLTFDDPAYYVYLTSNFEFDSDVLRFAYSSFTTPRSTYDYDMRTNEKTLLKQDRVLGEFDREDYRSERLQVEAHDGVQVPVSLVYRKDTELLGKAPLVLYGYGSYGITMEATFSSARLSLLDRGFVFAIAHVRGGEEMGRSWYDDGKRLKKRNTFTDFIACAEHLVKSGYAHPKELFAWGGSAGGLLVGAVVNMRPELFKGIVAHVPFVDVVTTMLDETIPLTTGEYHEWGDPREKAYYDYILSYSPYDNVDRRLYPHMLVTAGLHDSQVQYWEPAKWVAKLRDVQSDSSSQRILLKTNMEAGHHGVSGRFESHRETALAYAFLIDLATDGE